MQEALSTVTANPRIDMPYPHLYIEGLNNALTTVVNMLEVGDLPVVTTYEGRTYKIATISRSPLNISRLLRITSITLHKSENVSTVIRTNEELLEVGVI